MKKLRVTFSDNKTWEIPAEFIAQKRAAYYAARDVIDDPELDEDEVYQDEYEYTVGDNYELLDWACNHMNWEDFEGVAVFVQQIFPVINYRREWSHADKEIIDG